jgi:dimethylglycine dehydrogenase
VAAPALARIYEECFHLMSPAADEQRHEDWLRDHLPTGGGVSLANVTAARGVLAIAGPRSRELIAALTEASLANGDFPWFAARQIEVAGVPVLALRMSLTGELGWELHHDASDQPRLYDALRAAGDGLGLVDFGLRALESMRLEKGWCRAGLDYGLAAMPDEAGLERFIHPEKGDFLGRDAFRAARTQANGARLVGLRIDVGDEAIDPWAEEAVFRDGAEIARATSGGHGHRVGHPIALARLPGPTRPRGRRWKSRSWTGAIQHGSRTAPPTIRRAIVCGGRKCEFSHQKVKVRQGRTEKIPLSQCVDETGRVS